MTYRCRHCGLSAQLPDDRDPAADRADAWCADHDRDCPERPKEDQ